MFGCNYAGDGNPSSTGNVASVTGQTSTIAAGMNFDYLYQEGPDQYVDDITANGGTISFISQDGLGRAVTYSGPTNNYRAIHSTFIFGALRSGVTTKDELMLSYLDYLLSAPGVHESGQGFLRNLATGPNPFNRTATISFGLSKPASVDIGIYNIAGQTVRRLNQGELNAGMHQFIWDGTDDRGQAMASGSYILKLTADSEILCRTLVLVR